MPSARTRGRPRRRERGVALILALLVLAVLIVLIGQMTATSLHNRTVSENQLADLQNAYAARSGYHQALVYLQADLEKEPNVDSLQERWAGAFDLELAKARVNVSVRDAERFINLSRLVNDKGESQAAVAEQLQRLVHVLGHPPEVAERIIDYIDADSKGPFEARARNERLFNAEELLRIEGIPREVLYGGDGKLGLLEFVTAWPREAVDGTGQPGGVVNANTAPAEVLAALSDKMTLGVAQAIVAYRSQPAGAGKLRVFEKVDDVRNVEGMSQEIFASISGHLTVRSEIYEVRVRSAVANIEKIWVYVVHRKGGDKAGMKLLASQRSSDPVSVKAPEPAR